MPFYLDCNRRNEDEELRTAIQHTRWKKYIDKVQAEDLFCIEGAHTDVQVNDVLGKLHVEDVLDEIRTDDHTEDGKATKRQSFFGRIGKMIRKSIVSLLPCVRK